MARYIDVDNIKFDISGLVNIEPNDYKEIALYFLKQLDEMPVADVRENVHGEWMKDGRYMGKNWHRCSICDRAYSYVYDWNFCPNCGADMRGDNNEIN